MCPNKCNNCSCNKNNTCSCNQEWLEKVLKELAIKKEIEKSK